MPGSWRVTLPTTEEIEKYHAGSKMFKTEGNSTFAVSPEGDIWGVCHYADDPVRGWQLIAEAVKQGGKKLDSFLGNHDFYVKCGFEPVSWCEWDEGEVPKDWIKGLDLPEDVVFYKYVGIGNVRKEFIDNEEFKEKVPISPSYDAAKEIRNKKMEA
jgi:hypothetical protein